MSLRAFLPKFFKDYCKMLEGNIEHALHQASYVQALLSPSEPWLSQAHNLHFGQRCFILGNGPSLNKTDVNKLKKEITFGCNGIYLLENFVPTYYVTISATFWKYHIEEIKTVKCERRFLAHDLRALTSDVPTSWINFQRPKYLTKLGSYLPVPAYFSRRPDKIVQGGGTVLFVCLQLAYYMGFKTVILLGVDHTYGQKNERKSKTGLTIKSDGKTHFSRNYSAQNEQFHIDINSMERGYQLAHKNFTKNGRTILNASPGTKLDIFQKIEYHTLFDQNQ